jgi:hypothetical protein
MLKKLLHQKFVKLFYSLFIPALIIVGCSDRESSDASLKSLSVTDGVLEYVNNFTAD